METNMYCVLGNGELVSKRKVDDALDLLAKLREGFEVVRLTDEELFAYGNTIDAIMRFREKHDTTLTEAKYAIEFLRGKETY